MQHCRKDYDRIQDPAGLIPDDEPVFLIRAKDKASTMAVLGWANEAERMGCDPNTVGAVRAWAAIMTTYRCRHQNGGKVPDTPADQLKI